jgi:hypothetical protein
MAHLPMLFFLEAGMVTISGLFLVPRENLFEPTTFPASNEAELSLTRLYSTAYTKRSGNPLP